MDFSKHLFRCSSLGYLMTEPKSNTEKESGELSETVKTHLADVFVSAVYGRETDIQNKYCEKGIEVEQDSITLYSLYKSNFYKKNEVHLNNGYIQGTPDIFIGADIHHATFVPDIKSSWDIFTHFRNRGKELNKMYYWQMQGYLELTGAKDGCIAYCLVNTPERLVEAEKRKLWYSLGGDYCNMEIYEQGANSLEANGNYDDIPLEQKIIEIPIKKNYSDIEKLYKRIDKCRAYLNKIYKDVVGTPNTILISGDTINGTDVLIAEEADLLKTLGINS